MQKGGAALFNPAAFPYADFMDPRFQNTFRSAVGHHPHASASMYPHFPSYAQLYNTLLPNASIPMVPGMMKMVEEEQRLRLLREEEALRQKEAKRQKEAQREKERKEREQRERLNAVQINAYYRCEINVQFGTDCSVFLFVSFFSV